MSWEPQKISATEHGHHKWQDANQRDRHHGSTLISQLTGDAQHTALRQQTEQAIQVAAAKTPCWAHQASLQPRRLTAALFWSVAGLEAPPAPPCFSLGCHLAIAELCILGCETHQSCMPYQMDRRAGVTRDRSSYGISGIMSRHHGTLGAAIFGRAAAGGDAADLDWQQVIRSRAGCGAGVAAGCAAAQCARTHARFATAQAHGPDLPAPSCGACEGALVAAAPRPPHGAA